jgi:hypothetical protein
MTVKEFCNRYEMTENQFYGKEEFGGGLDLRSLTSIPPGFNPTVGGYLGLGSLISIPPGFNPTVGGYLDLRSLKSIPEGFALTVGGSLDLRSLTSRKRPQTKTPPMMLSWRNGKIILIDSILSEVISRKGNIWKTNRVGKKEIEYIVTDGDGKYAHGATIKEAKADLIYKIKDRDTSKYQGLALNTVMSFEQAVECYRVITGACIPGVKGFVEQKGKRDKYTIAEMIEVTRGQYGNETFKSFFKK